MLTESCYGMNILIRNNIRGSNRFGGNRDIGFLIGNVRSLVETKIFLEIGYWVLFILSHRQSEFLKVGSKARDRGFVLH